ncbi:MAG: hypothetical protein P4L84_01565 [Isosphaeraceae bacterium]|nr:hypothetical protein [Isosphaeraceae bacterium]
MIELLDANPRSDVPIARRNCLVGGVFVVIGTMTCFVPADETDSTGQSREEALATRRFELMQTRVATAKVQSNEPGFPTQFAAKPIFRYSDPARGYVAAAVWKLGDEGRPRALLTSELDRKDHGPPCISYEYVSLTSVPFSLASDDMRWSPSATLFEFKPLPKAPAPEESPPRRLRQLREFARRFASREEVKKERCELRLLPAPVDRYTPSNTDRADGAIFFFTFGTNPEVVLLIESDGKEWKYAAGRMTGAQVVVLTLDNAVVWEAAPLQMGRDSPFTGSITPLKIPGIAADGSEVQE